MREASTSPPALRRRSISNSSVSTPEPRIVCPAPPFLEDGLKDSCTRPFSVVMLRLSPSASASASPEPTKAKARAYELCAALDQYATNVKVLSLDCFDTILWRRTAAPTDVFYDMQGHPAFVSAGINAKSRVVGEGKARELKAARTSSHEVVLSEIYRGAIPSLDDAAIAALEDAEIEAEIEACYALPDAVALIRAAKAKGLQVIIVSDTYLTEAQLRRLLGATLPAGVLDLVDHVFASSAYGVSKGNGLFKHVLDALKLRGRDVLHMGDNESADLHAATAAGIHAVHLHHHETATEGVLRLQGTAASLLLPEVRGSKSLPNPFRGIIASTPASAKPDATFLLGYAGLGPVLYSFARWLGAEIDALRAEGKSVKPVFLLRDGFMPSRVAEIVRGAVDGPLVAMSRFAAFAASFSDEASIERYIAGWAGSGRFADMARQLLLTPAEASPMIVKAQRAQKPAEAFAREILRPKIVAKIIERAAAYRDRLFKHLETSAGVTRGDTVVFVDLGYEGTAQRQLQEIFRTERGVEIAGRYLIAARIPEWEKTRRGLIDPSWCDDRMISTVVTYIALLENLCTADAGSTIDYAEDGTPILAEAITSREQHERVAPIQAACEAFARDAKTYFEASGKHPPIDTLRVTAVGALARMLFLHTEAELDWLADFSLDLNLATNDRIPLFDRASGLDGLRRRGLFFLDQDQRQSKRIATPIELRAASLELALALLGQHRFGLEFSVNDMTHRRETLNVLVLSGTNAGRAAVEARATHDGFFSLVLPVGGGEAAVGVLFGERYSWVQIESVTLIELSGLYTDSESKKSTDITGLVLAEGLAKRAKGLFECTSKEGFLLIPPVGGLKPRTRYAARVVFRPVEMRDEATKAA